MELYCITRSYTSYWQYIGFVISKISMTETDRLKWKRTMPSKAQLTIFSFVCTLLMTTSAYGAPATAVQRQRRQTFDFNSNTDDNDSHVDGQSTTTPRQDIHFDFNGDTSNVTASTNSDAGERAPLEDYAYMDPDTAPVYHDYGDDQDSYFPGYDDDDDYDKGSDCESQCSFQCLISNECITTQCPNYTCPSQYDDYYDATTSTEGINATAMEPRNKTYTQCKENGYLWCLHGVCTDGINCICEEGWVGAACNLPCTLKCVYGNCKLRPNSEANKLGDEITEEDMFCNCVHGFIEDGCSVEEPDNVAIAEAQGRRIAIILGMCLSVAVFTSIILPVVLWRKRVIFVMKVVYFFRMWEDNDGKIYDAYISAGTTGRALKFVKTVLAPKLEQKGFKLFIPSRDQLCGAVISEDIITAIKQSRRTIMVVTPEYLQNDWSGFEVLNAQVEMIKLQQRIIPVILEDISKEAPMMRKSLKHIMESVKCLKVPGYKSASTESQLTSSSKSKKKIFKFWQRLELTMPKKRDHVSSSESNCYIQKDSSQEQSMHDGKYSNSKSISGSAISPDKDQTYECIEENHGDFHTKTYNTMVAPKLNPLSVYNISSKDQDIDITKFEQCFNFKSTL